MVSGSLGDPGQQDREAFSRNISQGAQLWEPRRSPELEESSSRFCIVLAWKIRGVVGKQWIILDSPERVVWRENDGVKPRLQYE